MDCGVCEIRSSVGYCVTCRKLLCEECGLACVKCGKLMCDEHVEKTRHGRIMCPGCMEARRAERAKAKGEEAGARKPDTETATVAEFDELDAEERVLAGSVRKQMPPWKVSLFTAVVGVLAVVFILIFPSFRRIPLFGMVLLQAGYLFLLFPALAIFWAVVGLRTEAGDEDADNAGRKRCYVSLGLATLAAVLSVVAIVTDPARHPITRDDGMLQDRNYMTEQQLDEWREQVLDKFNE